MVPAVEYEGCNLYNGSIEEVIDDATARKRNIIKEQSISPRAFTSLHKTSTSFDDKIRASSLNQYRNN